MSDKENLKPSRKRNRNESNWERNARKIARNEVSYYSASIICKFCKLQLTFGKDYYSF